MSAGLIVLGIYCIGIIIGFSYFVITDIQDAKKCKLEYTLSTYDILEYILFGLIWPVIFIIEIEFIFTNIFKYITKGFSKLGIWLDKPLIKFDYSKKDENEDK